MALEKRVLIISLGAKLKIAKCKAIRDWFLANTNLLILAILFTNFFLSRRLPKGFVEDKNVQQKVVEYFASFLMSISRISELKRFLRRLIAKGGEIQNKCTSQDD